MDKILKSTDSLSEYLDKPDYSLWKLSSIEDKNIFFFRPAKSFKFSFTKLRNVISLNFIDRDEDDWEEIVEFFMYFYECWYLKQWNNARPDFMPFVSYLYQIHFCTYDNEWFNNYLSHFSRFSNIEKYKHIFANYYSNDAKKDDINELRILVHDFLDLQYKEAKEFLHNNDNEIEDTYAKEVNSRLEDYDELIADISKIKEEEDMENNTNNSRQAQAIAKDFIEKNSPSKIYEKLSELVYKQESAKKSTSMLLWNHMQRIANPDKKLNKNNYLMIGPTGSGKTELGRALKEISPLPVLIIDSGNLTGTGWKGLNFYQAIKAEIQCLSKKDKELVDYGIYILDEADKMFIGSNNDRDGFAFSKQASILKAIEEGVVVDSEQETNVLCHPKDVTFVLAGAFTGLLDEESFSVNIFSDGNAISGNTKIATTKVISEKLIDYGMKPELAGRVSNYILLNKLSESDLFYILKNFAKSTVIDSKKRLQLDGIKIDFTDNSIKKAAHYGYEKGFGVRGANSMLQAVIEDLTYDAMASSKKHIKVTSSMIVDQTMEC